jgi:dTDP-glucose 4,6-dehydratase
MRLLVTGGCGFIGSALCLRLIRDGVAVVNADKLTYAAHPASLAAVAHHPLYAFERADIADAQAMDVIFERYEPDAVAHLAAESHVDRSIGDAADFVRTNLLGTYVLLEAGRRYWAALPERRREKFRFVHVSTDEVFGSLSTSGSFDEETPYRPSSPYSATKAGSDHLAEAWRKTYGLPVLVCNCSNNYGPRQFPEKLIPLAILNALEQKPVPVYGDGLHVRDWLFVEDFVDGLVSVIGRAAPGERYNFGGGEERTNLQVARAICAILDSLLPGGAPRDRLIAFVADRPGHDERYAMNSGKAARELGWRPHVAFEDGLARTVRWYLDNRGWWEPLRNSVYRGERLGLLAARR